MRKTLSAVLLISMLAGASAHLSLQEQHLQEMKSSFNSRTDDAPAIAGALVGNQTVVAHIKGNSTTVNLTAEFSGLELEELRRGSTGNSTVEVWVSREALVRIGEAEEPRAVIRKALGSGAVRVEVSGFFNQLRFSLLKALL
ncbi:MAG: hypothetical protein ABEJ07_02390 [Candidatus Nanohaloarchaea archaeon]